MYVSLSVPTEARGIRSLCSKGFQVSCELLTCCVSPDMQGINHKMLLNNLPSLMLFVSNIAIAKASISNDGIKDTLSRGLILITIFVLKINWYSLLI